MRIKFTTKFLKARFFSLVIHCAVHVAYIALCDLATYVYMIYVRYSRISDIEKDNEERPMQELRAC